MERMGVTRRAEQAISVPGAETKRSSSSLEGEKCLERRREFFSLMVTYSHARDSRKYCEPMHLKGPVYHIKMVEKLLFFMLSEPKTFSLVFRSTPTYCVSQAPLLQLFSESWKIYFSHENPSKNFTLIILV